VVIVDSTVWIDYLNGKRTPQTEWLDREVSRQRLGLLDLVLCEVLQGLRHDERFRTAQSALLRFEVFATGGVEFALAAAINYRAVRARGRTLRATIDAWIATFCLLHDHRLLHDDRDFDHFEQLLGLQVVHP
jgi:hypothetical protein